jgi:hypothetical protein
MARLIGVQDAIVTDPSLGMPTTVGSHVFASMKGKRNAGVVDKVVQIRHGNLVNAVANEMLAY